MKRKCVDKYDGPTVLGLDWSTYQGLIAWHEVVQDPQKIEFAIGRTNDGLGRDAVFVKNVNGARPFAKPGSTTNLRLGSYTYFRCDRDGKAQAKIVEEMWSEAGGFEAGHDVPPAIDIEEKSRLDLPGGLFRSEGGSTDGVLPPDLVADECLEFLEEVNRVFEVRPIVYTGQAFHWWFSQGRPDLAKLFEPYPLWLPSYSACPLMPVDRTGKAFPWSHWTFWQYSAEGKVQGIKNKRGALADVDLNRFRGDSAALAEFCAATKIC